MSHGRSRWTRVRLPAGGPIEVSALRRNGSFERTTIGNGDHDLVGPGTRAQKHIVKPDRGASISSGEQLGVQLISLPASQLPEVRIAYLVTGAPPGREPAYRLNRKLDRI